MQPSLPASRQATRALRAEIEQAESLRASVHKDDASPDQAWAVGADQRKHQDGAGGGLAEALEAEGMRRAAAERQLDMLKDSVRILETQLETSEVLLPMLCDLRGWRETVGQAACLPVTWAHVACLRCWRIASLRDAAARAPPPGHLTRQRTGACCPIGGRRDAAFQNAAAAAATTTDGRVVGLGRGA